MIIPQYWKDKKGAVKRKLVLIRTTNRTHPGEDSEEEALSSLEKRILALIGGRAYALSNKEEEGGKLYALTNKEQEIGKVYALSNKETGKLYAISNKEEENDPFTVCCNFHFFFFASYFCITLHILGGSVYEDAPYPSLSLMFHSIPR